MKCVSEFFFPQEVLVCFHTLSSAPMFYVKDYFHVFRFAFTFLSLHHLFLLSDPSVYFQTVPGLFSYYLYCLCSLFFGTFRCSGLLSDCSWKALWTWHTLWHLMVTGVSTSFLDTGVGPLVRQLMTSECLSLTWYTCVFCMLLLSLSLKHFKIHSMIYFLLRVMAQ